MNALEKLKLEMIRVSNERNIRVTFYPSAGDQCVMSAEAPDRATYDQFVQDATQGKGELSVSHEYELANGNVLLLVDVKAI